jgi:NADPH:quinone reductase-like Zn-dependent oxidoreductase
MQAIVYDHYGSSGQLRLADVDTPVPADREVLIRIGAVSINGSDRENLVGRPIYTRLAGVLRPRRHILGSDIAGEVVAVGADVQRFRPGDTVYGELDGYHGGFAEYACAPAEHLSRLPTDLTFDVAAALPQAGVIALAGTRGLKGGQRVLINGAGGSVGTFAVQLAARVGATVTAVDRTDKLPALRELGAHEVIDYTCGDFSDGGPRFDRILDLVAHRSARTYVRSLNRGGSCLVVGGSVSTMAQVAVSGPILRRIAGKDLRVLMVGQHDTTGLRVISELCAAGTIQPVIQSYQSMNAVPDAMRAVVSGDVLGKAVITLD